MTESKISGDGVETVAKLVKDLHQPQILTIPAYGDNPEAAVLVTPRGAAGGFEVTATSRYSDENLERPKRRKGSARLLSLASFIDHVNRFKGAESALFAKVTRTPMTAHLLAVYDYHDRCNVPQWDDEAPPQALERAMAARPDWLQHKAGYDFPFSKEWQTWTKASGVELGQADFAEFLEDHILDVMEPPGFMTGGDLPEDFGDKDRELLAAVGKIGGRLCGSLKLMELSRGLKVHEESVVENAQRLDNGEARLVFKTEHRDEQGKPLEVPSCFLVAIPVFEAGEPYRILVRLRYRKAGPLIKWTLMLHRAERAFEHAAGEACEQAAEATGLPLFYGSPEA